MLLKHVLQGIWCLLLRTAFPASLVTGCVDFSVSKIQAIHLMLLEKSLSVCKFLTFKMLSLEDTVWNPSGVQGTQGLFYGIPAVPAELASLMSNTGNPPSHLVCNPFWKKHHSKALRLPVNGRLKFMMTGQLVKHGFTVLFYCVSMLIHSYML